MGLLNVIKSKVGQILGGVKGCSNVYVKSQAFSRSYTPGIPVLMSKQEGRILSSGIFNEDGSLETNPTVAQIVYKGHDKLDTAIKLWNDEISTLSEEDFVEGDSEDLIENRRLLLRLKADRVKHRAESFDSYLNELIENNKLAFTSDFTVEGDVNSFRKDLLKTIQFYVDRLDAQPNSENYKSTINKARSYIRTKSPLILDSIKVNNSSSRNGSTPLTLEQKSDNLAGQLREIIGKYEHFVFAEDADLLGAKDRDGARSLYRDTLDMYFSKLSSKDVSGRHASLLSSAKGYIDALKGSVSK